MDQSTRRLELQNILERVFECKAYFQAPGNLVLNPPYVFYEYTRDDPMGADNMVYSYKRRYEVTYVTRDPDDEKINKITVLPGIFSSLDRHVCINNLHHYYFNLYF